jgi:hypothetical protein
MFECSLCKCQTDYPSEWKRHIYLTKHQKLIRTKKNLYKEEHDKNNYLLYDLKINKLDIEINKLEEELNVLKEELKEYTETTIL